MFHTVEFENVDFTVPQRYQDLKLLGSGAQGFVCSAYDNVTSKYVAIKKLKSPLKTAGNAKRTFREFKIMAHADHKNVMGLLNAFTPQHSAEDLEDVYLVMELMDMSLSDAMARCHLGHELISFFTYQMLLGVKHLHAAGILHRDLKPDNVAIRKADDSLKILDFGLARPTGGATVNDTYMMTSYVVTRWYRAPEVVLEVGYKEKMDVWSIGCIVGEMIKGSVLFKGADRQDQWDRIAEKVGMPPKKIMDRLDATIKSYVETGEQFPKLPIERMFPKKDFPKGEKNGKQKANDLKDLLSKIFVVDPEKRISVDEALKHRYLEKWYSEKDFSDPPPSTCDNTFIEMERSLPEWKDLIFQQVMEFQVGKNPPACYIECATFETRADE